METAIEAGPPVGNESGLVIMVFFICVGVTVALSILGGWHLFLISVSETTIEFYLNKREAMKLRKEGKVGTCWVNESTVLHTRTHMHAEISQRLFFWLHQQLAFLPWTC